MSGGFSNIFSQKYSNLHRGTQQCLQPNPTDDQKQHPYSQSGCNRTSSDQPFGYEQTKGSYDDQMFKSTTREPQKSNFPSSNCQISCHSNVVSRCDSKPQTFSNQQQQRMPVFAASNSQVSVVSNFNQFSSPVFSQQQRQTPSFYENSSLQQPYSTSGLTKMCSPVSNQQIQFQQNQRPDKMLQFSAPNILPPNLRYQRNQGSFSYTTHQANTNSHFSNNPTNQQGHYQQQSTSSSTVPSSSNLHSNISNQHIEQTHCPPRLNQTLQFPVYKQMPPNISYQPPDNGSLPTSQNSINSFGSIPSHHENTSSQQKIQLHQQSFATNQQQHISLQQIQHNQSNVFTSQTDSSQSLNSVPFGSTSITSVCNQQNSKSSGFGNQTLHLPAKSLPSNPQNSLYHIQVVPPGSQVPIPLSGAQPNLNTGMSSFGPSNISFSVPSQHHFGNYRALGNVSEVNIDVNKKSQSELLPNQHENTNLQQIQYRQPNASNTGTGNPQQLGVIPPRLTSVASIGDQHSLGQQNRQLPEFTNQVSLIPGNSFSTNSQSNLYQKPAVTASSQIPVPLPVSSSQPNLNIPSVLSLGPSSNVSFPPVVPAQQYFGNYQTLGNVSEMSIDVNGKSQSEIDSEWVSQWLAVRGKEKTTLRSKKSVVAIPEIRKLLHQASTFLKALSLIRDSLKSCKNDDNETWNNKTKQAMHIKHRLQGLMENLLQPEVVLQLLKKLRKIKKKRELHRKQREKRKMEKLEQQKKRLEIHRCLDSYMETEKEKVLQAKREEELKKEADNILSEVRRKLQEGKRAQERLRVIEKLRQARKETAQKRGLHISEETDRKFSDKITHLKEIIHKQLMDYDAEEKALKVMLETEQEGQLEQEETNRKERQRKLLDKMQEEIKQCLFADNDSLDVSDPLWYFRQYYTQAESSLEALLQTRRQWDMYLVAPTSVAGSSVPACWITPDLPNSDSWASALSLKEYE